MKRFSKGLVAVAASASLLMGSATVAQAAEKQNGSVDKVVGSATGSAEATVGSAALGSTGVGLAGSAYADTILSYAAVIAVVVGAYNWAVDQHLIQPIQLPR